MTWIPIILEMTLERFQTQQVLKPANNCALKMLLVSTGLGLNPSFNVTLQTIDSFIHQRKFSSFHPRAPKYSS